MAAMKGTKTAKEKVKKEKIVEGGLKGMKGSRGKVVKVGGSGRGSGVLLRRRRMKR